MNKTAFIFPGQGAQAVGMDKIFYDNFNTADDSIKRKYLTFSASVHDWRLTS